VVHMRVSRSDATVIYTKDKEVNVNAREVAFDIRPVSTLTDLSGGQKDLYFEMILDYRDQWQERDELDNVRGVRYHLH